MLLLQGALALLLARTCAAADMTNSWAVQVRTGGKEAADALAEKHGFINLGQVGPAMDCAHSYDPWSSVYYGSLYFNTHRWEI
jgi:hypothetical protein